MNLKSFIKRTLQKWFGYNCYLSMFAHFKITTLNIDPRDSDFLKFIRLLSKDDVVLDIGANLGYMTVHLSRAVPAGMVIAIEPVPENIATLRRMVDFYKCKNVLIEEAALGSKVGNCCMAVPVINGAVQQGLCHLVTETSKTEQGRKIVVPMRTLDDIVDRQFSTIRISAIKMDVEDHESEVLKGGINTIIKSRPIVYTELWATSNRVRFIDLLSIHKYDVYVFQSGRLERYFEECHRGHSNFFFIPQERVGSFQSKGHLGNLVC